MVTMFAQPSLDRPDDRDVRRSMIRGFAGRCPHCGTGQLFSAYLKVVDECPSCHEQLHYQRADDAPPYFVMMIVGHVLIVAMAMVEDTWSPPMWVHAVLWLPLTVILSLLLLPRVKGAIIGLQWANRMHGFAHR